jgi:hypothetical protein
LNPVMDNQNEKAVQIARNIVDIVCASPNPGAFPCKTAIRNYEVEGSSDDPAALKKKHDAATAACGRRSG